MAALHGAGCTDTSRPGVPGAGSPGGGQGSNTQGSLLPGTLWGLCQCSAVSSPWNPWGWPVMVPCPVPTLSPCRQQSQGAPRKGSQEDLGPAAYRARPLLAPLGTPGLCRHAAALWGWPVSSGTPCPAWSAMPGVGQGASPTSCLPATAPGTLEAEPGSALFQV